MSAYLAESVRPDPLAFNKDETKKFLSVFAKRNERNRDCSQELFFGVFFDGTNNNADRDRPADCHSNVARLFDTFPPVSPLALANKDLPNNHFRIYAPGVGTKFDDVGDTGEGDDLVWGQTDRRRGLAFAEKGEARIVWALLSVLNALHIYFLKTRLRDREQVQKLANDLTEANLPLWTKLVSPAAATAAQWIQKRQIINARRNEVLGELCRELEMKIKEAQLKKPKPKVLGIRLSVFGFSRGAAEARTFSNWFVDMCRAASGGMSIAGLTVDFDFLGIFDTVASVGLANSTLVADGHMEWADAEKSLRIPDEVTRCVHLVSAHELRRSFPLDSIRVGRSMSNRHLEVVYPGVHSDVGGGYKPKEQGRGTDDTGKDLISRIALAHMYREARLANVPLDVSEKGVSEDAKGALAVSPSTATAFNAYLDACKIKKGRLEDILDEQTRLYVRWRKARLSSMADLASVKRADLQDRTDLLEANRELDAEAKSLAKPIPKANLKLWDSEMVVLVKMGKRAIAALDRNGVDARHFEEWQRLQADWNSTIPPLPAVSALFEDYVHDSRAWFKPMGDDDQIWKAKQQERMKILQAREEYQNAPLWQQALIAAGTGMSGSSSELVVPLSASEKHELETYRKTKSLPPQPSGREPFWMGGGYLRFRRVYYGSDATIVARAAPNQMQAEQKLAVAAG